MTDTAEPIRPVLPARYDRSDDIRDLMGAFVKAQAAFKVAVKDAENPHFRSHYADLSSVFGACLPALHAHGLALLQPVHASDGQRVTVTTVLAHAVSGQYIQSALTLTPNPATPQGIGSAITYARRYGLGALLGIVTDDDDDGNSASNVVKAAKPAPPRAPAKAATSPAPTAPAAGKPLDLAQRAKVAQARINTVVGHEQSAAIITEIKAAFPLDPANGQVVADQRDAYVAALEARAAELLVAAAPEGVAHG